MGSHLIIVAVFVVLFLAITFVAVILKLKGKTSTGEIPYQTRGALLSPAELSFFRVLQSAVGQSFLICPKVRLADILKPVEKQNYQTALNKISRKHIDFVLCDQATTRVFGVVELDDKSHGKADRVARDAFVDNAFAAAGIQIVHFKASMLYSVEEVRQQLRLISTN
ncbi:MAG TPA: DUF2726 domain-containing protein [Verrucomicrobiae bacterium]|jgi:hypothetical protein